MWRRCIVYRKVGIVCHGITNPERDRWSSMSHETRVKGFARGELPVIKDWKPLVRRR